ncbi:MAG: hypothetical protein GX608_06210 [Lentisphaerae bacterium]|nr:hypothetical protein [Lentisphaerota bacterium]
MKIEVFALCDAATDYYGKLNILGAFDSIWVKQMPATHPHCAVALRIRFSPIEEGEHKLKINVVDADGKLIMPSMEGNLTVKRPPKSDSIVANVVLNIQGLKFAKCGDYSVDLAVDGRQEAALPLQVREVQNPAAQQNMPGAAPGQG